MATYKLSQRVVGAHGSHMTSERTVPQHAIRRAPGVGLQKKFRSRSSGGALADFTTTQRDDRDPLRIAWAQRFG